MRKSELEYMVGNLKNQMTAVERVLMDFDKELQAMVECLNLVRIPPVTSKLKYKKKKGEK